MTMHSPPVPSQKIETAQLYRETAAALEALIADESDAVAIMANAAALLWRYLPDINWVGFYRAHDDALVLGPFQGGPACVRIAFGKGVCGTAAATRQTQLVDDVHAFAGHIACDAASAAEIVVPIIAGSILVAVLDIDSSTMGRFDAEDRIGCESLAAILARSLAPDPTR